MNSTRLPDRKLLEDFVVGNDDLDKLESSLGQFNIFEALRAVRQETRHSAFLAFLLDPSQNHGLGDAFAKRLLQKALASSRHGADAVSPIDLDVWDLDEMSVHCETDSIDILMTDERHKLAVVVENKIDSGEHSDQLKRYRQIATQRFVGWNYIFLFLTPDGDIPSDEAYLPIDYDLICEIVEDLAKSRASILGADVRTLMVNYTQMLRRHIVSESETAELCRRIYHKHKEALDLIYEHRPDRHAEIRDFVKQLIEETSSVVLDRCSKAYIDFCPNEWDQFSELKTAEGWTKSRRMLLFEFVNYDDYLRLYLIIGPGPQELRKRLFDFGVSQKSILKPANKAMGAKWSSFNLGNFLASKPSDKAEMDEIKAAIRKEWAHFATDMLPQISSKFTELLNGGLSK